MAENDVVTHLRAAQIKITIFEPQRFIYLSSAKVNGEFTSSKAYSPHDEPNPADAYARSKWEGELAPEHALGPDDVVPPDMIPGEVPGMQAGHA